MVLQGDEEDAIQHMLQVKRGDIEPPPRGWNDLLYEILRARDVQAGEDKAGPADIGLIGKTISLHAPDMNMTCKKLQKIVQTYITEMHKAARKPARRSVRSSTRQEATAKAGGAKRCSYPLCKEPDNAAGSASLVRCEASRCAAVLHHLCMGSPGEAFADYSEGTSVKRLCFAHLTAHLEKAQA